jgi:S-adenosylmethionine synthetase
MPHIPALTITSLLGAEPEVEVVERKGAGHPDSICDGLAETLSRDLCRVYIEACGRVLHHNVDKALLRAGRSAPALRGGQVLEPIEIYLAGRATAEAGGGTLLLEEIAVEGAKRWLGEHLRALDPAKHVVVRPLMRPGSSELAGLFDRGPALANDTSVGVGYAPYSDLERLVLALDGAMTAAMRTAAGAAWGEDTKIMAVRRGRALDLTIACAMIDRWVTSLADYQAHKEALQALALDTARSLGFDDCRVAVNAADGRDQQDLYLTVTGTSAECGDDGQVGRGNRVNGLITPGRPMSLEAAAGKNPVTHVGKIYNLAAHEIAGALVRQIPQVSKAECLLVSRIGRPIAEPALIQVGLAPYHAGVAASLRDVVEPVVTEVLAGLPARLDDFVQGRRKFG